MILYLLKFKILFVASPLIKKSVIFFDYYYQVSILSFMCFDIYFENRFKFFLCFLASTLTAFFTYLYIILDITKHNIKEFLM